MRTRGRSQLLMRSMTRGGGGVILRVVGWVLLEAVVRTMMRWRWQG